VKWLANVFFWLGALSLPDGTTTVAAPVFPELNLDVRDRILVLAPHPDDEVLGCGGILQEALAKGLAVRVVFLTCGDHNEWAFTVYRKHPVVLPAALRRLGSIREAEASAAGKILGLSRSQITFLGYPDLGTLRMWTSHWNNQPPLHSLLINAREVPYTNALRPRAPFRGDEILRDLTNVFREFRPTKIFVSHPADHHPDHRALYLFATVALWTLGDGAKPELLPYLVHYRSWPEPKGMHGLIPLEPPPSLREPIRWVQNSLAPEIVERNRSALQAHRTQYEYSSHRLLALLRANELFGDFPFVTLPVVSSLHTQEPPPDLTAQERADLLAVDQCHLSLDGEDVVFMVGHSRALAAADELSLFAFGYHAKIPFSEMPKLHVTAGAFEHHVYDQTDPLPRQSVAVRRESLRTKFRISLKLLGRPSRVLTTVRTHVSDLPVDWTAWRTVELPTR
jgi:LmbE family N-acetylglucosaminyl deacetylase